MYATKAPTIKANCPKNAALYVVALLQLRRSHQTPLLDVHLAPHCRLLGRHALSCNISACGGLLAGSGAERAERPEPTGGPLSDVRRSARSVRSRVSRAFIVAMTVTRARLPGGRRAGRADLLRDGSAVGGLRTWGVLDRAGGEADPFVGLAAVGVPDVLAARAGELVAVLAFVVVVFLRERPLRESVHVGFEAIAEDAGLADEPAIPSDVGPELVSDVAPRAPINN